MRHIYLRFLNLMEALDTLGVDGSCRRLLEIIAIAHTNGQPLTVSQAMKLHQLASPATIHRKLQQLIDAGLVQQSAFALNRRTKLLAPTAKADHYFRQVGRLISDVHRPTKSERNVARKTKSPLSRQS